MKADASNRQQRIVLLITVGAQDVKPWVRGDDGLKLDGIPARGLRAKHLALCEEPGAWTLLNAAEAGDPKSTGGTPSEEAKRLAEKLGVSGAVFSADGRLCLATAKLEPVIEAILAQPERMQVVGALVFYTERLEKLGERETSEKDYANEPVASGHVAGSYLRDRLGLATNRVAVVNCLEGCAGRYEGGLNEHDDFPLRREIVHRIDRAVMQFIARHGDDFEGEVVPATMTTGGIDAVKQVVPAIAELRFASAVRDLSAPETDSDNAPEWRKLINERLCTDTPRITRHEAIFARGRALNLIRQGDPVSAWATVHRLAGSQLDSWWLVPLECTASYFGGTGRAASTDAPQQVRPAPGNESVTATWREALSQVSLSVEDAFEQHRRYALNAAMRVELALQGRDRQSRRYAVALASVCTMIDAAVIARAIRFLEKKDNRERIEGLVEKYQHDRDWFFLHKNAEHPKGNTPNNNRNAWFGSWHKQIRRENPELHADLTEHFADLIALERLLGIQNSEGQSLRALRNSASHRALTSDDIVQIAVLAENQSTPLWSRPGPQRVGEHALGFRITAEDQAKDQFKNKCPGPIPAVLKSIGVDEPVDAYRRLVGSLESILLTCEPETGP